MSDGNRNNNWANWLGLAVGAAAAAGAGYLAYNATQQLAQRQPEYEENEPRRVIRATDVPDEFASFQSEDSRSNRFNFLETSSSERSVLEKHKAAAPYYFFLSSVNDSRNSQSEPLSLSFADILDRSLGDLESSLHLNFRVESEWLMNQYEVANQRNKPITLIYGEMEGEVDESVISIQVKSPPKINHHTKMCVLAYRDGSVRVCVHTANLVEFDWENCVQGIWLSPLCPALPRHASSNTGESRTNFKNDLIQYLCAYNLPQLQPWIGKLRGADFSNINVFFVASTPGSHCGMDSDKWGYAKLAKLLKQHVQVESRYSSSSWQIIAQCSSIGSLGPESISWFCGDFQEAMSEGLDLPYGSPSPIKLVYPSSKNVEASYDGRSGGRCLTYTERGDKLQPWLQNYLFKWKCDSRRRSRTMPHIKTYARVSPDHSQLAWFHLTSANLSKAAWGSKTDTGAISIANYEAGVLFMPKHVLNGSSSFPIKRETAGNVPVFPMPYDLPLAKYDSTDVPWFIS